jgi:hypothetical protein
MIYGDVEPNDWKDLQGKVAQVLRDIGCETEVEKVVQTVRGTPEIDVFAVDSTQVPNLVYLCECKHWSTPVPQSVIHAFRTVVADYGAHVGILISRVGFQSGAYEATRNTNIQLLSWQEFQMQLKPRWRNSMLVKLDRIGLPLRDYTDPWDSQIDRRIQKLEPGRRNTYLNTYGQYLELAMMSSKDLLETILAKGIPPVVVLPEGPNGDLRCTVILSEKELLDLLIDRCEQGIQVFDDLFGEQVRL